MPGPVSSASPQFNGWPMLLVGALTLGASWFHYLRQRPEVATSRYKLVTASVVSLVLIGLGLWGILR